MTLKDLKELAQKQDVAFSSNGINQGPKPAFCTAVVPQTVKNSLTVQDDTFT